MENTILAQRVANKIFYNKCFGDPAQLSFFTSFVMEYSGDEAKEFKSWIYGLINPKNTYIK